MENLNDYVLHHIFIFLPQTDVEIASEVCRRWHSVIASSKIIMRSLLLEIKDETIEVGGDKLLKLPYRNIHVLYLWPAEVKEKMKICEKILLKHCDYIEKLKLVVNNHSMSFAVKLLPMMSNISELSLVRFASHRGVVPKKFIMDFPNLKNLSLLDASTFINRIRSHKIETLKVAEEDMCFDFEQKYFDKYDWNKFFGTCDHLKNLTLQNFERDLDFCAYGFKLSSLIFLGYYEKDIFRNVYDGYNEYEEYEFFDNIVALIRSQKDSLKEISIAVEELKDPDIMNFMVYDMKLEKLNFQHNNRHPMNFVEPKENTTIKKFKLRIKNEMSEKFLDVLKTLHAVEDFYVAFAYQSNGNDLLRLLIHHHMPKLKTLTFRDNHVKKQPHEALTEEGETVAPQVETLFMRGLNFDKLKEQFKYTPNIKKLIIKDGYCNNFHKMSSEEFKIILKSLIELEELELEFGYEELILGGAIIEIDDEVLALITQSKLRRLTIEYCSYEQAPNMEFGEKLKDAKPNLVVTKKSVPFENWLQDEADEICHYAVPERNW